MPFGGKWCPAPRDFFEYAGSQVFNFSGGAVQPAGNYNQANANSGKATYNIISGGGVNNAMLVADKSNERHFLSGSGTVWANLETAFSKRIDKNWKLTATAYVWDSRSLLGERNSLKLSDNKTSQASIGVAYEY